MVFLHHLVDAVLTLDCSLYRVALLLSVGFFIKVVIFISAFDRLLLHGHVLVFLLLQSRHHDEEPNEGDGDEGEHDFHPRELFLFCFLSGNVSLEVAGFHVDGLLCVEIDVVGYVAS